MRIKTVGNKADSIVLVMRNADTVTINQGQPVCLNVNGTNDGLDVVLPSTGGAAKAYAFAYGICVTQGGVAPNAYGESQVFGFCNMVQLTRQTRAASTAAWASENSIASYVILQQETVANGMQTTSGTQAATAFLPFCILGQSLASYSSSASATSDSRTAITASVKAFLRVL